MSLPEVIARPPWPAPRKRNVLALEVPVRDERVVWKNTEQYEWAHPGGGIEKHLEVWEREEILTKLEMKEIVRIDAATNLEMEDLVRAMQRCEKRFVEHYAIAHVAIAKYGLAVLDALFALLSKAPACALDALRHVDSLRVASWLAPYEEMFLDWASFHPVTAALSLLPAALGDSKDRKIAQKTLSHMRKNGHEQAIRDAAALYGPDASAEIDALFAPEPLPSRAPSLPEFVSLVKLPMPLTKEGEIIGEEPRARLVQLLSLLPLEAARDAIDQVKAGCDADSLATLGVALADEWVEAGAETKHKWALLAAGALGDDIAARKLAEWTVEWAKAKIHARSRVALEALSLVGTDVALMHTDRIARTMKGALRTNAAATLDEIAKARNLSQEELGDRLVPSLGLDPSGSTWLDFGARRFRVSFDEALVPELFDVAGERLARLPRANKDDDEAKAARAIATFKGLQSDAKKIAPDQVRRLERAMCTERSWSVAEFRTFFIEHPLMVHLARRLVWLTDNSIAFRIIEDRTFAGEDDRERTIPGDARIRIAHPISIASSVGAWSTTFTDYLIVQPFPQLGRETYALTAEERESHVITRFEERPVPGSRFFALKNRGWGFYDYAIGKVLRGGYIAMLDSDPGLGFLQSKPEDQKLGELTLRRESGSPAKFGDLSRIDASELVRDVELLVK